MDGALEGEHTFTKTGRQRRATYAIICQWIVDAWADISVSTVVQAFTKAGIITELPGNSSDTDSDNDEREPGMLDAYSPICSIRTLKKKNSRDSWTGNELKK